MVPVSIGDVGVIVLVIVIVLVGVCIYLSLLYDESMRQMSSLNTSFIYKNDVQI